MGYGITTDGAGNIYTTGFFNSTADFDPNTSVFSLASVGSADVFVQKLNGNLTSVEPSLISSGYALEQTYPNPANDVVNLQFTVPATEKVTIQVYNLEGQLVKTVYNENASGTQNISFSTQELPAGMYAYCMRTANQQLTKRMIIVK